MLRKPTRSRFEPAYRSRRAGFFRAGFFRALAWPSAQRGAAAAARRPPCSSRTWRTRAAARGTRSTTGCHIRLEVPAASYFLGRLQSTFFLTSGVGNSLFFIRFIQHKRTPIRSHFVSRDACIDWFAADMRVLLVQFACGLGIDEHFFVTSPDVGHPNALSSRMFFSPVPAAATNRQQLNAAPVVIAH